MIIGITLIATGFEHKSPFKQKPEPVQEGKKENEKVVVVLEEEKKKPSQPLFLFDEKNESLVSKEGIAEEKKSSENKGIKPLLEKDINVSAKRQADEKENLAPKIVEIPEIENVKLPGNEREITVDKSSEQVIRLELSSEYNPVSSNANFNQKEKAENLNQVIETKINKDASTAPTSGGYLAKPKQIYAEVRPKPESETPDKPAPLPISKQGCIWWLKIPMIRWRKIRKRKYTKRCLS